MPISTPTNPELGIKESKSAGLIPEKISKKPKKRKEKTNRKKSSGADVFKRDSENSSFVGEAGEAGEWKWVALDHSGVSKHPPIFTKDGNYFFAIAGPSIKIHATTTGQVVSTLKLPPPSVPGKNEHSDNVITAVVIHPQNAYQLITGSLDGRIAVWDFLDAVLILAIETGQPIRHLCSHERHKDYVFISSVRLGKKTHNDDSAIVLRVALKTADGDKHKSSEVVPIGRTRSAVGLAFSPSGSWLVAAAGHKAYVIMMSSLGSGFTKYVSPEKLSCLAFHPSEEYFATGDEKGIIRLWYCLNGKTTQNAAGIEKKAQTTTLHWHAHSISSLAFTPNGAYLLSGGEEAVLVVWQLHTGKREFIPRVGAPINSVSVSTSQIGGSEGEYLLGLADATFTFVNASSLRISRSYSQIKLDPSTEISGSPTSPLAVHPLSSTIILPSSHPSSLQIYSPSSSRLVSELEVSPSNRVSRRDDEPLQPSRVTHAVTSKNGEWLATVDRREGDDTFRSEIYLKFWWWDQASSTWILNTRIDRPHGLLRLTGLEFSPVPFDRRNLTLVTTGEDGKFKIWRTRTSKTKDGRTEEHWVTRSVQSFRSATPTHASWSPDGSLLSVSFRSHIVLYDPSTNLVHLELACSECKTVTSSHFVGRSGRYLLATGSSDVAVWDLISQTVSWSYKSKSQISRVVAHPSEDIFAVFGRLPSKEKQVAKTTATIFHCSSSFPQNNYTLPFDLLNLIWYSSSSKDTSFSLLGITKSWSVVLIGDKVEQGQKAGGSPSKLDGEPENSRTLFQDIFGRSAFADLNLGSEPAPRIWADQPAPVKKKPEDVFLMPAYQMPPLESVFDTLIENFLQRRPDTVSEQTGCAIAKHVEREDDEMDVYDSDVPVVATKPPDREEMDIFVKLFKLHALKA